MSKTNLKLQLKGQKFFYFLILTCTFALCLLTFNLHASAQTASPTPRSTSTPTAKPSSSPTLKPSSTPTATATASPDVTPKPDSSGSSQVREKVRETIENLKDKPKAVIGNLEQITDTTLQIKDEEGKLLLVATNNETSYGQIANNKRTEIKFSDLAIGDFTVSIGFKNGNNILEARRVIAYDEKPKLGRHAILGEIIENKNGSLTIKHIKLQEEWTIETDEDTVGREKVGSEMEEMDINDLEPQTKIVVAGLLSEKENKTIFASLIYVVPTGGSTQTSTPKPSPSVSPSPRATSQATAKPTPTSTP